MDYWNGSSMMQVHGGASQESAATIFTDVSESWGCGTIWGDRWLQCRWSKAWEEKNIATKELLPNVLAMTVWGDRWRHKCVLVKCDNMAVVQIVNRQNCREPGLLHLMW